MSQQSEYMIEHGQLAEHPTELCHEPLSLGLFHRRQGAVVVPPPEPDGWKTQEQMSESAAFAQGELSKLERRDDHLVSTLRRYVDAMKVGHHDFLRSVSAADSDTRSLSQSHAS
jgi:hypothetical protein